MNGAFRFIVLTTLILGLSTQAAGQTAPIRALSPNAQPATISLMNAVKKTLEKNEDLKVINEVLKQQEIAAQESWAYVLPNWSINGQYQMNDREQSVELQSAEQLENQALLYESIAGLMEQSAAAIPDPTTKEELEGQAGDLRNVADEFRSTEVEPAILTPREVVNADTTLRVPLFNGRALPLMRNAYTMIDMAQLNREQVRQTLSQATIQSYYNAWLSHENLESARRQFNRAQEHVAATQRRVDAGILPISNLHRARGGHSSRSNGAASRKSAAPEQRCLRFHYGCG